MRVREVTSRIVALLVALLLVGAWCATAHAISTRSLFTFTGAAVGDRLGNHAVNAGDLNGDGYQDWAIGAFSSDVGGANSGQVYVYLGGPGADAVADLTLNAEAAGDNIGPAAVVVLGSPYPNPSARSLALTVRLEHGAQIALALYDVSGRQVARRAWEPLPAGPHLLAWDPGGLRSGLYFLRVELSAGPIATRRWAVFSVTRPAGGPSGTPVRDSLPANSKDFRAWLGYKGGAPTGLAGPRR